MAAPYVDTTALSNLVQTAYDRKVRLALYPIPKFRDAIDVHPVDQAMPGSSVVLNIYPEMALATSALDEVTDPSGSTVGNPTPITVTLHEYGTWEVITKANQAFNLDNALDSNLAQILARNLAKSINSIIESVMAAGTQVLKNIAGTLTVGGSTSGVTATSVIKSEYIRYAVTKLEAAGVVPFDGENYVCYIHPDVVHDLQTETGELGWRYPQNYNAALQAEGLLSGEIGTWNKVRFVTTPYCSHATTGASSAVVYQTYLFGKEAVVEATAEDFHVVLDGTIVDPLKRKFAMGWYGIAGWALFRSVALWRIETSSSVA